MQVSQITKLPKTVIKGRALHNDASLPKIHWSRMAQPLPTVSLSQITATDTAVIYKTQLFTSYQWYLLTSDTGCIQTLRIAWSVPSTGTRHVTGTVWLRENSTKTVGCKKHHQDCYLTTYLLFIILSVTEFLSYILQALNKHHVKWNTKRQGSVQNWNLTAT